MARWSVDIIGKRLQHLGTVVASDERKALEEAIKQFAVRQALRSKTTVTKVAETTDPNRVSCNSAVHVAEHGLGREWTFTIS
jgi:hypothetical protein